MNWDWETRNDESWPEPGPEDGLGPEWVRINSLQPLTPFVTTKKVRGVKIGSADSNTSGALTEAFVMAHGKAVRTLIRDWVRVRPLEIRDSGV